MKYCTTCKELEIDDTKNVCPKCGHPYMDIAVQQEEGDCAFCKFLEETDYTDD